MVLTDGEMGTLLQQSWMTGSERTVTLQPSGMIIRLQNLKVLIVIGLWSLSKDKITLLICLVSKLPCTLVIIIGSYITGWLATEMIIV